MSIYYTPVCRIVYPFLAEPKPIDAEIHAGKYTCMVLIPKDENPEKAINAAIKEAADEFFKGKLPPGAKLPLKDGDEKLDDNGDVVPMYEGHWYINLSSNRQPTMIGPLKQALDAGSIKSIKGGDYARVKIAFVGYNSAGNKGVGAYMNAIQFIRAGDPLGGTGGDLSGFDAVEDELADAFE